MMDTIEGTDIDVERYRLRNFVDKLIQEGEVEIHDQPVALADVAAHLDGNPKAVLFRNAGPEGAELVGNVMGSRGRLAHALGVDERELLQETLKRLQNPIAPFEIPSSESPVHDVVLDGDDADLTALPVHLQHGLDGAPYISATLDFAVDRATGWTNVGMRRLMLRGRREAGIDLNAPSDLRVIYGSAHTQGDRLPIALAVGSHPVDAMAALCHTPRQDELALLGALRGAPVPVVKCVTNDLRVSRRCRNHPRGLSARRGVE